MEEAPDKAGLFEVRRGVETCHVFGMEKSLSRASLLDGSRMAGFRTRARIKQHDRDPMALVITLARSQKKPFAAGAARSISASMTARGALRAISPAAIGASISNTSCGVSIARPAA
jgi:hypothetical protein